MAYKVTKEKCDNCGKCEEACPSEAISEKNGARLVNPDNCVDCGSCEGECPKGAIGPE